MAKLTWDEESVRQYETGIDHMVVYPAVSGTYPKGYAWSGVTAFTESPSGAEATAVYADNIKYLNLISAEELGATLEAIQYPEEFEQCDGTAELVAGVKIGQQPRKAFGLVYRTKIADSTGNDKTYVLHLIWNALAAPSEKAYATVNDSPENMTFSWTLTTTKIPVAGYTDTYKPVSHMEIVESEANSTKLNALKDILFGTAGSDPYLPLPGAVIAMM